MTSHSIRSKYIKLITNNRVQENRIYTSTQQSLNKLTQAFKIQLFTEPHNFGASEANQQNFWRIVNLQQF